MLVTGSGPSKPEINVRSFDPALTVTRSVLPSKLPTKIGPGSVPTGKIVGLGSLKKPWPTPGSSMTLFDWLLVTRMSGLPSPVKFPTDRGDRPEPPELSRGPGRERDAPASAID